MIERWIIGGFAALGLCVTVLMWGARQVEKAEQRGRTEVVNNSKNYGAKANEKSEKARRDAAVPGSVDRLRKDPATCRDCK